MLFLSPNQKYCGTKRVVVLVFVKPNLTLTTRGLVGLLEAPHAYVQYFLVVELRIKLLDALTEELGGYSKILEVRQPAASTKKSRLEMSMSVS